MEDKDTGQVPGPPTPPTELSTKGARPTIALGISLTGRNVNDTAVAGLSGEHIDTLPWSSDALEGYRERMKQRSFHLMLPEDDPLSARLDAVFSLPQELWPILPPGAVYCMETHDPRVGFGYLQHTDYPEVKVRINTYFGKYSRHLVDFAVFWRPPWRHSSWQSGAAPPPDLPWEPRQVLGHTTSGEYQYSRTRFRFRGRRSLMEPEREPLEWCDAHGVDHQDTKAANESAPRNSDKDKDAHILDPPRPSTWGELARRPLIGRMRSRGGGAYVHHMLYDHSGQRTTCGRRVPAGYLFTLMPTVAAAAAAMRPASPARRPTAPPPPPAVSIVSTSASPLPGSASPTAAPPPTVASTTCPCPTPVAPATPVSMAPGSPTAAATAANDCGASSAVAAATADKDIPASVIFSTAASIAFANPPAASLNGESGSAPAAAAASGLARSQGSSSSRNAYRASSVGRLRSAGSGGGLSRPPPLSTASSISPPKTAPSALQTAASVVASNSWPPPQQQQRKNASPNQAATQRNQLPSQQQQQQQQQRPPGALSDVRRWSTYDVAFGHPLHTARAIDLGLAAAAAEAPPGGSGVRHFSDTAAVLQAVEKELRLPRAFVPAPLVLGRWEEVPGRYAHHLAAARELMPVSEEDASTTSKLHLMLYHLQHAATLEYDRLDAKLVLLPQLARLGRKSAEIDAWLQVIVDHATYLYGKLHITDMQRWPQARRLLRRCVQQAPQPLPQLHPLYPQAPARCDTPVSHYYPSPPPTHAAATAADALRRSASVAAYGSRKSYVLASQQQEQRRQQRQQPGGQGPQRQKRNQQGGQHGGQGQGGQGLQDGQDYLHLPYPFITIEEWAAITKIMDSCRHAPLYERWVRLRPLMIGAAQPGSYWAVRDPREDEGELGAVTAGALQVVALADSPPDPHSFGPVNGDLLDYLSQDMAAMWSPDYDPPPPPLEDFPRPRGYHGEGPPPPELAAPEPRRCRPIRCRGREETPLPAWMAGLDVWHNTTKMEQADPSEVDPHAPVDPGAVKVNQAALKRLQAAKDFATSRQAEVQRAMRKARGVPRGALDPERPQCDCPVPGEPPAEEQEDWETGSLASTYTATTGITGRTRDYPASTLGAGSQFSSSNHPFNGSGRNLRWIGRVDSLARSLRSGWGGTNSPSAAGAGVGTQTVWEPEKLEDPLLTAAKEAAAAEAAENRRRLLRGNGGKTREEILEEALNAADAAIKAIQKYAADPPDLSADPNADPDRPGTPGGATSPREAAYRRGAWTDHFSETGEFRRTGTGTGTGDDDDSSSNNKHPLAYDAAPIPRAATPRASLGTDEPDEAGKRDAVWRQLRSGMSMKRTSSKKKTTEEPEEDAMPGVEGARGLVGYGIGMGALVDYETAMARRRAIAEASVSLNRGRFLTDSEIKQLFITFCNMESRPDLVRLLDNHINAPLSAAALAATATMPFGASGGAPAAVNSRTEALKQRIRGTAWLLGVTWRRITNETYNSFLSRVLGYPSEFATSLPRTRCTMLIARALVQGHDPTAPLKVRR
ncbi:hypothetical protein Agub_g13874 [Astrephomene gubernaculifera]|uniref:Uncharacterized protein n=1 Tax=Astrephomene gubernaculifera TaxID=47775 RepID=A0AAD3E0K2_9CHLO|nr:hypothetical protein Agub_g13874 [Astrephomene gubernaculifera]